MRHLEQTWELGSNFTLFSQIWETETNEPKAAVCLVHGLGEHSGRYEHVAKSLTDRGFALLGFDLRGHGKSGGIRGHIDSADNFIEDIDRFLKFASDRYPDVPRFLYGHSLGGLLVLFYTIKRQPEISGVIATSPALKTALTDQKAKIMMSKALARFFPRLSLKSGLIPSDISRDPAVITRYREDSLVHDRGTLMMAKTSIEIMAWTFAHPNGINLPLLLMHGSADRITYSSGTEEFAKLVSGDCTLIIWEGLYHETHNEPQKEEVIGTMIDWLESKIVSPLDKPGGA